MKRLSFLAALVGIGAAKTVTPRNPEISLVRSRLNGPLDTEPGPYGTATIGNPAPTTNMRKFHVATFPIYYGINEEARACEDSERFGNFVFRIPKDAPKVHSVRDKDGNMTGWCVWLAAIVDTDQNVYTHAEWLRKEGIDEC